MGLHGSEYWTHCVPSAVGAEAAEVLTTRCQPMNARQAASIKFVDNVLDCDHFDFPLQVRGWVRLKFKPHTCCNALSAM